MSLTPQSASVGRVAGFVGVLMLLSVFLGGCAGSRRQTVEIPTVPVRAEPVEPLLIEDFLPVEPLAEAAEIVPAADLTEPLIDEIQLTEARLALLSPPAPLVVGPTYDVPIVINDSVRHFIDVYSRPDNRKTFEAALTRSSQYMEMFRRIFADEGVPEDMVYMAHVESVYKTTAYSRAGAKGIFQFMAATARRYGLRVDEWVDERVDPEMSARASARYMMDLYREFGDWYLALAGYNAGEGKIRLALRKTHKQDFWGLTHTRYLRRETKNHIPAFIAVTLISKEPEKYGIRYEPGPPLSYDSIEIKGATDLRVLARCAGTEVATLAQLNPAIRRNQTPPTGTMQVRVPVGSGPRTLAALEAIPVGERVLYASHRVRGGETLSSIARKHGVSVTSIQAANQMGRGTMIRENATLKIPTNAALHYPSIDTARDPGRRIALVGTGGGGGSAVTHTVRHGDTLWHIASLYRTSVSMLCSLNRISPQEILRPGLELTVRNR